mgnify:CR=1 FL=1
MTIARPNKDRDLKRCWMHSGLGLGGMILIVLLSHLSLVQLKHELDSARDNIEVMKVGNADLKNQYYQLISTENLERLATEKGLVKDKNPEWALVSRY